MVQHSPAVSRYPDGSGTNSQFSDINHPNKINRYPTKIFHFLGSKTENHVVSQAVEPERPALISGSASGVCCDLERATGFLWPWGSSKVKRGHLTKSGNCLRISIICCSVSFLQSVNHDLNSMAWTHLSCLSLTGCLYQVDHKSHEDRKHPFCSCTCLQGRIHSENAVSICGMMNTRTHTSHWKH